MARVSVVGTSGSGKTTVGRRLAERLNVRFVELDALRHQPGWVELPDDEFRAQVEQATAGNDWVIDGNYRPLVGEILHARLTEVVWLDLPRWQVMTQVIWRSWWRAALRQPLWNGNREGFRAWLQPTHPIRWAWSTFDMRREEYAKAMADSSVPWTRLQSRAAVARYLDRGD